MTKPERVLHVINSMNLAGAESLLMNIYRNIDRKKIQFDFLLNIKEKSYFEDEILTLGGRIYKMRSIRELGPLLYKKELKRFFQTHSEYKIIHSHLEATTGIILEAARETDKSVRIAHAHNSSHNRSSVFYHLENLFKDCCKRKIKNSATDYFACSELAADFLFGRNAPERKLIKNAIGGEKYIFSQETRREIRKEFIIEDDTCVIGHVGRFYEQKNHLFLIEVFEKYQRINPSSILWLIGDGKIEEKIRKEVSSRGIEEKVVFWGQRSDVADLMQAMDVFMLPSKHEGLSLALVEAQTAGLPCLVSDRVTTESCLDAKLVKFLPLGKKDAWVKELEH
ncbi:MAG TPA: glycosyltransferase family 1 protein, partial [Clostridiales bacterium]|nr:glycosyltransferase family 1 protein [Clostridiales bacterium]